MTSNQCIACGSCCLVNMLMIISRRCHPEPPPPQEDDDEPAPILGLPRPLSLAKSIMSLEQKEVVI